MNQPVIKSFLGVYPRMNKSVVMKPLWEFDKWTQEYSDALRNVLDLEQGALYSRTKFHYSHLCNISIADVEYLNGIESVSDLIITNITNIRCLIVIR